MKRPALLLLAFASIAGAASREFPRPPEAIYARASQVIALHGLKIESTDRASGLITASGSFASNPGWFACEKRDGILKNADFSLAVAIRATATGSTIVEMLLTGTQAKLRYHHVLFFKTVHHWEHAECESSGILEAQLLDQISNP